MKVIETHFVLEIEKSMGDTIMSFRKVYKLDRIEDTYVIERTNSRGAVVYKELSVVEFETMTNNLALKFYKDKNGED